MVSRFIQGVDQTLLLIIDLEVDSIALPQAYKSRRIAPYTIGPSPIEKSSGSCKTQAANDRLHLA